MKEQNTRNVPSRFMSTRERMKFLLMIGALVVIVGGMVTLINTINKAQQEKPATGAEPQAGPADETPAPPDIPNAAPGDGPGIGEFPQFNAEAFIYDPEILKEVEDNVDSVAPEALTLLIHWLQGKTYEEVVAETDTSIMLDAVIAKPAAYRGKIAYVEGVLEKVLKQKLGANSTGVESICFGRLNIVGEQTLQVSFYLLDGPQGAKAGDRVIIRGYFLSLWKHGPEGRQTVSPVFVGKRFDPPDWLTDPESLQAAEEGGFFREPHALFYCLEKIRRMTDDGVQAAVDRKVTPEDLKKTPLEQRGKFVSFTGAVLQVRKEKLPPNPTGLGDCYMGYLLDIDGRPCMFYTLDVPAKAERERVMVDGIFMKNYRYVAQNSIEREAPVIVGRTLRLVVLSSKGPNTFMFVIGAIVLIAIATAGAFEIRASRVRIRESRQRILKGISPDVAAKVRDAARKAKGDRAP